MGLGIGWTEFHPGVPLTVSKRRRRTNSTTSRVRGKKRTPRSRRSAPVPLPLPLPFQVSFPFFRRPAGKQCFQAERVNQGIVRLPITRDAPVFPTWLTYLFFFFSPSSFRRPRRRREPLLAGDNFFVAFQLSPYGNLPGNNGE